MAENNKAILEKANPLIAKGDNEGFLAFCTDDTVWTYVGGETLRGKEAVPRFLNASSEPSLFTADRLIADGDFLAALGDIAMKDEAGAWGPHAYCDVWRFRDGKMAELKAFVIKAQNSKAGAEVPSH